MMDGKARTIFLMIFICMFIGLIGYIGQLPPAPIGEHTEEIKIESIESVNEENYICNKKTDNGGLKQCTFPVKTTTVFKVLNPGEESYAKNITNVFGNMISCEIYIQNDTGVQVKAETENIGSKTAEIESEIRFKWFIFIMYFIWFVFVGYLTISWKY